MKIAVLQVYEAELKRQWPVHPPPELKDIEFAFGDPAGADHIVVLNGVGRTTTVHCDPERVWLLIQEPPVRETQNIYRAQPAFRRIYEPSQVHADPRRVTYWGALNWWVGKSYDELAGSSYPTKTTDLCFVTSNEILLEGHRKRMAFLERLTLSGIPFELWGRGFRPIADKWNVLAPSRYSVAFENYAGGVYWSEKLSDCFLSYSTPFYYGAANLDRHFPSGSYVSIDPDDPHLFERMRDIIASRFHENNLAALEEARHLCLTKYNTLFFIAREVAAFHSPPAKKRRVTIRKLPPRPLGFPKNIMAWAKGILRPIVPRGLMSLYRKWRNRHNAP